MFVKEYAKTNPPNAITVWFLFQYFVCLLMRHFLVRRQRHVILRLREQCKRSTNLTMFARDVLSQSLLNESAMIAGSIFCAVTVSCARGAMISREES